MLENTGWCGFLPTMPSTTISRGPRQKAARDVEREQIFGSTDAQLEDRLAALRERYDPKGDGGCFPSGGYPMPQLRELHLIEDELGKRERGRRRPCACPWCGAAPCESPSACRAQARSEEEPWEADNHSALDRATDVERYR